MQNIVWKFCQTPSTQVLSWGWIESDKSIFGCAQWIRTWAGWRANGKLVICILHCMSVFRLRLSTLCVLNLLINCDLFHPIIHFLCEIQYCLCQLSAEAGPNTCLVYVCQQKKYTKCTFETQMFISHLNNVSESFHNVLKPLKYCLKENPLKY